MTEISLLLVCREDGPSGPNLGGLLASPSKRIENVRSLDQAQECLGRDEFSLVVVHLGGGIDLEGVEELVWSCATAPRLVPVVVISDRYDEKQALTLFRAGVTDYLSLDDHGEKVSQIVGSLACRESGELPEGSERELKGARVLAATGAGTGRGRSI